MSNITSYQIFRLHAIQKCGVDIAMKQEPWTGSASWCAYQSLGVTLVAVGVVSNILIAVIMRAVRSQLRAHTCFLYAVALVDSLILINYLVQRINDILTYTNSKSASKSPVNTTIVKQSDRGIALLDNLNDTGCKLYQYSVDVLYTMASWLIAMLSIERFNVVFFPLRQHICTKAKKAVAFIMACFLAALAASGYIPAMLTEKDRKCVAVQEKLYHQITTYWSTLTLHYVLPALIICVCNTLVLIRMYKVMRLNRKGDERNEEHYGANDRLSKNKRRVTIILLIISSAYAMLHLPLVVITMYVEYLLAKHNSMNFQEMTENPCLLFKVQSLNNGPMVPCFGLLACFSYAINFFVYIIWGKRYRAELSRLLSNKTSHTTLANHPPGGNPQQAGYNQIQMKNVRFIN